MTQSDNKELDSFEISSETPEIQFSESNIKGSRFLDPDLGIYQLGMRLTELRSIIDISPSALSKLNRKLGIDLGTPGKQKSLKSEDVKKILQSKGYEFDKPAKMIVFAVNKGGAGKTTYSFYVSYKLACLGFKVLVVDTDPQGHAGIAFNFQNINRAITPNSPILRDIVTGDCKIEDAIIPYSPNLHVIPSTPDNTYLFEKLSDRYKNLEKGIKDIFEPVINDYDLIIFDSAPSIDIVFDYLICASDLILLPIYPDIFSKKSIDLTIDEIKKLEKSFRRTYNYKIIFTRYDQRENVSMQYLGEIAKDYSNITLKTVMRICTDYKNAILHDQDLFSNQFSKSKAVDDLNSLCKEILSVDELNIRNQVTH